ncbi:unnamed protein product [Vicia faba]|uniref:Uncharacterized protein n=1 Tax=Vicia faba TaxID=3906 RepID=A0AAV0ZF31_VICFA|nr:unnamed protein product [Vicia faba]
MGVKTTISHSKYFGLPVVFGRLKKEVFALVVEKVWKKVKGWKEEFLSRAEKEKGSRWRIGNGENVLICKDRWIFENAGFRVTGRVHGLDEDSLVNSLIDKDLGQWKRDLIFSTFEAEEAKLIVSIPLSRQNPEDKIIWHWEKNDEYSVR